MFKLTVLGRRKRVTSSVEERTFKTAGIWRHDAWASKLARSRYFFFQVFDCRFDVDAAVRTL